MDGIVAQRTCNPWRLIAATPTMPMRGSALWKSIGIALLVWGLGGITGCRTNRVAVPAYPVEHIDGALKKPFVEIVTAATAQEGWLFEVASTNMLTGVFSQEKRDLLVDIQYATNRYQIVYKSSRNRGRDTQVGKIEHQDVQKLAKLHALLKQAFDDRKNVQRKPRPRDPDFVPYYQRKGLDAEGMADEWLENYSKSRSKGRSLLPPDVRERADLENADWVNGQYANLKSYEMREVRKGKKSRFVNSIDLAETKVLNEPFAFVKGNRKDKARFVNHVDFLLKEYAELYHSSDAHVFYETDDAAAVAARQNVRTLSMKLIRALIVAGFFTEAETLLTQQDATGVKHGIRMGLSESDIITLSSECRQAEASKAPHPAQGPVTGTGWFVNSNHVVTCWHVVKDGKKITCRFGNGAERTLSVVAKDEATDVAVLKMSEGPFASSFLPIDVSRGKLADPVFTVGYPLPGILGQSQKYSEGTLSALAGIKNDVREYQISVPVQPGNSGGALVGPSGGVVGIVSARLNDVAVLREAGVVAQNVNYAVKSRYLVNLLEQMNIIYEDQLPRQQRGNQSPVEHVEQATVLIRAE